MQILQLLSAEAKIERKSQSESDFSDIMLSVDSRYVLDADETVGGEIAESFQSTEAVDKEKRTALQFSQVFAKGDVPNSSFTTSKAPPQPKVTLEEIAVSFQSGGQRIKIPANAGNNISTREFNASLPSASTRRPIANVEQDSVAPRLENNLPADPDQANPNPLPADRPKPNDLADDVVPSRAGPLAIAQTSEPLSYRAFKSKLVQPNLPYKALITEPSEKPPAASKFKSEPAAQMMVSPEPKTEGESSKIATASNVTRLTPSKERLDSVVLPIDIGQTRAPNKPVQPISDVARVNPVQLVESEPQVAQIELIYRPNVPRTESAQRQLPQKNDTVQFAPRADDPRKLVTVVLPQAAANQPIDSKRKEPRVEERVRFTSKDVTAQTQQLAPSKQIIQAPSSNHYVGIHPTHSQPLLASAEGIHISELVQLDDVKPQIVLDGPEVRRDVVTPQKIEPFARPVVHQMTKAATAIREGSVEVRLAPEELGRVRLSLSPGEANITIHITAERQETMDLIRRNIELFSQSLKQEGFTNLAFSFGGSDGDQSETESKTPVTEPTEVLQDVDNMKSQQKTRVQASGQLDIRI